jgi:3'-phosphoadenosine 5'-phosphosulfate sulfotransferase (PAPS reductase)/FAD synthetase
VPINWTKLGHMVTGPKPVMLQSYLGCCWENISLPLFQAAHQLGVTHLVTGQRNEEGVKATARHQDTVAGVVRVHPIEDWTTQQVFDFLATKMIVPEHFSIKHSSLDCYDCTGYEHDSSDRVQWTAQKYPEFYSEYAGRKAAINEALKESLCPTV